MSALDMGAAALEDVGAEPSGEGVEVVEGIEADPVLVDGTDEADPVLVPDPLNPDHRCSDRCSLPSGRCMRAVLRENPDGATLEVVGREFNLTRERIRQIETIALGKLRRVLREFDDHLPGAEEPKPRKHRGKGRATLARLAPSAAALEALEDDAAEDDSDGGQS